MPLALTLAAALAPPVTLDWQAPDVCPDAATVTAMTLDLLRERPQTTSPPLRARAVVTRAGETFKVTLEMRGPDGDVRRTLGARDCQLLARGVALLIAVHLDPLAVSRIFGGPALIAPPVPPTLPPDPDLALAPAPAPTPDPAPILEPEPAPAPVFSEPELPDLSPEPAPAPVPETSFGGHLRLEGGVDAGLFRVGGDAMLVGGLGASRWRVDLGVVGSAGHRISFEDVPDRIGRIGRIGGLVRGCAIWRVPPRRDRLALLGCLGAELDAVRATSNAPDPPTQWTPWGAALAGISARITLAGPLGLWLGVEAEIALRRPITYTVGDSNSPFTSGRAGVRGNFGIDLQFVARKRRPATTP